MYYFYIILLTKYFKIMSKLIKSNVTEKESIKLHQMSKNMQRFLADTKGIPCKIIKANAGEKITIEEEEVDAPFIYQISSVQNKKGSKRFPWNITFDLNDIDDKGLFRRHLSLGKEEVDFIVTTNAQLMFLLDFFQPSKVEKPKVKETETKEPVK